MGVSEGQIMRTVLTELAREGFRYVPVGISVRHVHLSQKDLDTLFGSGYQLHPLRDLSQPGQFAAEETVTLEGPKGTLEKVRIIGPVRRETQAELALTDAMALGMKDVPVRLSGDLAGTPGIRVTGPSGSVSLPLGAIIAARHLHMSTAQARIYGLHDGQVIALRSFGQRSLLFEHVILRAGDGHELEFHIDTDEANACGLKNGDYLEVVIPDARKTEDPAQMPVPERVAKRAVYALTGREGAFSDLPVRKSGVYRPEALGLQKPAYQAACPQTADPEEIVLELVTEQDINLASARGDRHVLCSKTALITPAAADRAAERKIEIIRRMDGEPAALIRPSDGDPVLDLVTADDLNRAFREDRKELFCTANALITPAARERIQETGIRIIRTKEQERT